VTANVDTLVYVHNNSATQDRSVPWHGLGTPVPSVLTDAEALTASGLDWTAVLVQNYHYSLTEKDENGNALLVPSVGSNAVLRSTDSRLLGPSVGNVFEPVQNADLFAFGSDLVGTGSAKWDTAGGLKGGALTFASFLLSDVDGLKVGGEDSETLRTYLLVSNAHDGSASFRVSVVPVRVVCCNTLALALGTRSATWSVRHTTNAKQNVEAARRSLDLSVDYVTDLDRFAERLLSVENTREDVERYVAEWLPEPKERGKAQNEDRRDSLRSNLFGSPTVPASQRLTSWGLLQSATEWSEHLRDYRPNKKTDPRDRRLLSTLFGGPVQQFRDKVVATLTASRD